MLGRTVKSAPRYRRKARAVKKIEEVKQLDKKRKNNERRRKEEEKVEEEKENKMREGKKAR